MPESNTLNSFDCVNMNHLNEGMRKLPFLQKQILIYRFWENLTIEEIGFLLELPWNEVDQHIEESFKFLRTQFKSSRITKEKGIIE